MTRLHAFLIHLLCSALVAGLVAALVFWVWYPGVTRELLGVADIQLVVLGVDVVLGPLMTLMVFKPGKKYLKLDIGIIVLVQLAALGYGLFVVSEVRPAYLVFSGHRFDLVSANALDAKSVELAQEPYRSVSWTGPAWVGAHMPQDPKRRQQLTLQAVTGGADLPACPDTFVPLEAMAAELKANARPMSELAAHNEAAALAQLKQQWPDADGWFFLRGKTQSGIVLINRQNARVLALSTLKAF